MALLGRSVENFGVLQQIIKGSAKFAHPVGPWLHASKEYIAVRDERDWLRHYGPPE